ncbi:hypothetical protein AWU67_09925 [Microterricola viridarii]|uniref:Enoyl reductase (ER) domain-containing protein n=1 Tax=Microterricola viridarii TaxID=412690 RepID=A0A0X8E2Z0_9MICO|nr:hypothetical protein AWU67_09925 [Microterricola viridarii]
MKYSRYGGPDVLEVVEIEMPVPGPGEALIEVVSAGLNPADSRLREGKLAERMPAHFPQGIGSDFAGYVMATGTGVSRVAVNDAVIGHTSRGSLATHLAVPAANLTPKPPHLPWEVAGSLFVTGIAAWAAVNALGIGKGDTVVISAAAGGVGCIAAQLARLRGARVIGTVSERNADFLRQLDVIPVVHEGDVAARIRELAPEGVDAYLDTFGGDNMEIARSLGVPAARIRSVLDWEGVQDFGPDEYGSTGPSEARTVAPGAIESETAESEAAEPDKADNTEKAAEDEVTEESGTAVIARLARLAEQHRLLLPISDIFAIDEVREAFEELDRGHVRGKLLLGMHPVGYARQRVHGATSHGVPLKESASTVDVPTEHPRMRVFENLPPVLGHLRGQHHPHPSEQLDAELAAESAAVAEAEATVESDGEAAAER